MVKGDRHANSVANHRIPADHGGIQGPCRDVGVGAIAPGFAMLKKASALHTLIRQRHPTPSCGGHAPTAERTMIPARMCLESLDRRPGIREQPGSNSEVVFRIKKVRSSAKSGHHLICFKAVRIRACNEDYTNFYALSS